MVANHKESLVEEHYKTGSVDTTAMRDLNAVDAHCLTCSAKQGGFLSEFSKEMKQLLKELRK